MWKTNIKLRQNFLQFPNKELTIRNDARRNDQQLSHTATLMRDIPQNKRETTLAIYSVSSVLLISGIMSRRYGCAL